tara:strand:- start:591 stop:1217 length:627 start_codon:yes stop_codon:yes gene_type:complete
VRQRREKANPELITRINKILANEVLLSDWEKSFLASVKDGVNRYGSLTAKQESIVQRIEKNRDPVVQAARKSWNDNFSQEMRDKMCVAARYYLNNPPYFADLAARILNDGGHIPTEKQYRAMVENKYVQKVLDNMSSVPTFPVGSMARVRTVATGHKMRYYRDKMVMIIDYPDKVAGAAKGAIPVIILPVGTAETVETEVRWLKKARV